MRELIGEERIAWMWNHFEWFMVAWIVAVMLVVARNVWREIHEKEKEDSRLRELYFMCRNWYRNRFNR